MLKDNFKADLNKVIMELLGLNEQYLYDYFLLNIGLKHIQKF